MLAAADIADSRAEVEIVLVGWPLLHWAFVAASASSSTVVVAAVVAVAALH